MSLRSQLRSSDFKFEEGSYPLFQNNNKWLSNRNKLRAINFIIDFKASAINFIIGEFGDNFSTGKI